MYEQKQIESSALRQEVRDMKTASKNTPSATALLDNEDENAAVSIYERMQFLKKTDVFSTFGKAHIEAIAWLIGERALTDGQWLCREDDEGHELYIIFGGAIEVVKTIEGKQMPVYLARPGEMLGEMSVLGHMPRTASLRARGDTLVFVIKGPHFIRLLRENPDMALTVIEMLVHRLAA